MDKIEKLAQILALLGITSGCTTAIGLVAGPEVDRQFNQHVLQSDSGYTVTTDNAIGRAAGNKTDAAFCQVWDILPPLQAYDAGRFILREVLFNEPIPEGDHCSRWEQSETGATSDYKTTSNWGGADWTEFAK